MATASSSVVKDPQATIRTRDGCGGTGNQTWYCSNVMSTLLVSEVSGLALNLSRSTAQELAPGVVLEIGAGTGALAMSLAKAGWRHIVRSSE